MASNHACTQTTPHTLNNIKTLNINKQQQTINIRKRTTQHTKNKNMSNTTTTRNANESNKQTQTNVNKTT